MTGEVKRIKIGALVEQGAIIEIQDGNHGELHPKATDYVEDGIPFIMANDFVNNRVDVLRTHKIPSKIADKLRIGFAQSGDTLLTHKGTVGSTAIVESADPYWMLTPQVTYYRTDPHKLNNRYLMYAFQEPIFQKTIKSRADQATRPYIGITAQRTLDVLFCSIHEQLRIVGVLRPYDEMISNNIRKIELLEKSARLLFNEWFLQLRYPGHEHSKCIDGVPEGWNKERVEELSIFINRGITPRYDDEAENIVVNQKCIRDRHLDLAQARRQSKEVPANKLLRKGDVLINSTGEGTLGRVAQVLQNVENCTVDSHVTIVRPKAELKPLFFGMSLTAQEEFFAKQGRGATNQTELSKGTIQTLKVLTPPRMLMEEFETIVEPIFSQIVGLSKQNTKLERARELLLPRLMTGRITV